MTPKVKILISFLICIPMIGFNQYHHKFYRYPRKEDSLLVKNESNLIQSLPTEKNIDLYLDVARSLWNLERNEASKKMLLNIIESDNPKHNATYWHNSDIPGDTNSNVFGYGSFSSNYKNSSCLLLTKILIEEQEYKRAYSYLVLADSVYKVEHTCGTGYNMYQDKLRELYGLCYEGMEEYQKAITLLLPKCFDWNNSTIIRILKDQYSQDTLIAILENSLNNVEFHLNPTKTEGYTILNYGKPNERKKKFKYTSGYATTELLGIKIYLPEPPLDNKDVVTKEQFIQEYINSRFYRELSGYYDRIRNERLNRLNN